MVQKERILLNRISFILSSKIPLNILNSQGKLFGKID